MLNRLSRTLPSLPAVLKCLSNFGWASHISQRLKECELARKLSDPEECLSYQKIVDVTHIKNLISKNRKANAKRCEI